MQQPTLNMTSSQRDVKRGEEPGLKPLAGDATFDLSRRLKANLVSVTEDIYDFSAHYHFRSGDLAAWPGKILILESDQDEAYIQCGEHQHEMK